ncbi:efflux transporter outer membrane subunit [Methylosinus sp. H3A]|nr:efflux transporter outer membrane subunit [Methylosinus sp. H3A]
MPLLFGACAIGPDHKTPDMASPDGWKEARSSGHGISADEQWWRAFRDPVLEKLVREADVANLDTAQAFDRLLQARADLGASQAGVFPSLDGSGSFTQSRGMGALQSGAGGITGLSNGTNSSNGSSVGTSSGSSLALSQSWNTGVTASWEVDLWGKTRRSIEASEADLGAAEADLAATRLEILGGVAETYVDLRTAQARIVYTERAVEDYRDALALTKARKVGGLVAETEVVKAEASLAAAEAQVPPLRANAARARRRLAVLTGRNPGEFDELLDARKPLPAFHGRISAGIPADLLRRRPDIVKAERKLAAATARVGVAQAEQLPTVKISGTLGGQEFRTGSLTIGGFGTWSIGPTVTVPIFDAGKKRFQAESKAAQSDEAADAYRAKVLSVLEEAENAFSARKTDCSKRDALSRSVARYGDALRLSKELYAKGLTGFLDVLDAERSLYSNLDGLASAQGQCVKDVVTIFKTLGGGW